MSGHEDPTKPAAPVRRAKLATAVDTLVVLMGAGRLRAIAAAPIAGGRRPETASALVAEAQQQQRVVEAPLGEIGSVARAAAVAPPALFVAGAIVRQRGRGSRQNSVEPDADHSLS